jgi:hypothetical protein
MTKTMQLNWWWWNNDDGKVMAAIRSCKTVDTTQGIQKSAKALLYG